MRLVCFVFHVNRLAFCDVRQLLSLHMPSRRKMPQVKRKSL